MKYALVAVLLVVLTACATSISPPRYLAVANQGNNTITIYDTTSGRLLKSITTGIDLPVSLAEDNAGDLVVANMGGNGHTDQGSVTIYPASNYLTETPQVITAGISRPESVALDREGNLFVANMTTGEYGGHGSVTEYSSGHFTDAPVNTIRHGVDHPRQLLFTDSGDLLVLSNLGVSRYAPGSYIKPVQVISRGMNTDQHIALGSDGALYAATPFNPVANVYFPCTNAASEAAAEQCAAKIKTPLGSYGGLVTIYSPTTYTLSATLTRNDDAAFGGAIAIDESGNIFVADDTEGPDGGSLVSMFSPLDHEKPKCTLQNGINRPYALAVEETGVLLVANEAGGSRGTGSVTEYNPRDCSGSALLTIAAGVNQPGALRLMQ